MLRGLPDDLDSVEVAAIRQASATACQEDHHQRSRRRHHHLDGNSNNEQLTLTHHHSREEKKTLLHRTVQRLVAFLVLTAHLLFCLLKEGVRLGARWERDHHVSSLVVERGIVAARAVSESPAGQAAGVLGRWALGNVVAGVRDGLGEGVGRLGFGGCDGDGDGNGGRGEDGGGKRWL